MAHCGKCHKLYDWCECEVIVNSKQALEMAEALCLDNEHAISSLGYGAEADKIVEFLWEEIDTLRGHVCELMRDGSRLREELDESNGVIR